MTFEAFDANGRWIGRLSFPITTLMADILYVVWKHGYTLELTGITP